MFLTIPCLKCTNRMTSLNENNAILHVDTICKKKKLSKPFSECELYAYRAYYRYTCNVVIFSHILDTRMLDCSLCNLAQH